MSEVIKNNVIGVRAISIFLKGKTLPTGEVYKPSLQLLLPKDKLGEPPYGTVVSDLRTAFAGGDKKIEAMTPEKFMEFCAKNGDKFGIKDLNTEAMTDEKYASLTDYYAVKFNASAAFPIVSPDNKPLTIDDLEKKPFDTLFKGGCPVILVYGMRAFNYNGNKGVSRYINGIKAMQWETPEDQIISLGSGVVSAENMAAQFAEYSVELPTSDQIDF
jgi:hypothetical protein